jgi:hypothetical protein
MTMSYAGANPRIHRSSSDDLHRKYFQKESDADSAEKSAQGAELRSPITVA